MIELVSLTNFLSVAIRFYFGVLVYLDGSQPPFNPSLKVTISKPVDLRMVDMSIMVKKKKNKNS